MGVADVRASTALSRQATAFSSVALALAALVALVAAKPAAAHEAPYSYLTLSAEPSRLSGTLTAHGFDLAHELGAPLDAPSNVGDSLLTREAAARQGERLFAILSRRFVLGADGRALAMRLVDVTPDRERRGLTFEFEAPLDALPARIDVAARLFPDDQEHETDVNADVGGVLRHQDLLDRERTTLSFATAAREPRPAAVFPRFVSAGIHHIFIGPDHILFVLGLLLLGGGLGRLLKIVTAFTIAHSVTLALATLGWVTPPARVIEPLIALSIVFVAFENLRAVWWRRQRAGEPPVDRRAWLAFAFGFVHGFGFASVLREFGLPPGAMGMALLAFNLGVEVGQAAIVVVAAPLFALVAARGPAWRSALVGAGSCVVAAAGAWWFVERALPR